MREEERTGQKRRQDGEEDDRGEVEGRTEKDRRREGRTEEVEGENELLF